MLHFKVLFLAMTLLSGCVTTDPLRYKQLNPMPAEEAKEVALILNTYPLKTPSPTVIYAHGCSGLDGAYLDWKNKLNDWGYNVLVDGWTESEKYGSKVVEDFGARKNV